MGWLYNFRSYLPKGDFAMASWLDNLGTTPHRTKAQAEAELKKAVELLGRKGSVKEKYTTDGRLFHYVVMNSTSFANGQMKAQNAISEKMVNVGIANATAGEYYHVEQYGDQFFVEDAEGGDDTGPFTTKAQAQTEADKRNRAQR